MKQLQFAKFASAAKVSIKQYTQIGPMHALTPTTFFYY